MLITARYLVDRLRYPRSRADEVAALRRRFAEAPGPEHESAEGIALAAEMRRLREALSAARAVGGTMSERGSLQRIGTSVLPSCRAWRPLFIGEGVIRASRG